MSTVGGRPPLRVISIAWGDSYIDDFLELCLPAILAPGNLPVLCEHFAVEFVVVTEERLFDRVRQHPAYAKTLSICGFRLIALDDLVATRGSYGMSITYAFYRGFEDLGPAMTECTMVFAHADFILADGCYRGLLPHLLRGERLVFSPSYCTVAEDVRPLLLSAKSADGSVLSIQPREMADIILRYRHMSVRAKTVNQRCFSVDPIEQFYWIADERTLLVRQFPVAVVAMKPERALSELGSYWDYGVIADFCPSMRFAALGDSDDYVMLELRERANPKGVLKPGWPAIDTVAKGLLTVMTDYVRRFAHVRFAVHSHDLPADVEGAHQALDAFVDEVLAHLPANLPSHHNHLQWRIHYDRFHEARQRFLAVAGTPALLPDEQSSSSDEIHRIPDSVIWELDTILPADAKSRIQAIANVLLRSAAHAANFERKRLEIEQMRLDTKDGRYPVVEHISNLGHLHTLFGQRFAELERLMLDFATRELHRQGDVVRNMHDKWASRNHDRPRILFGNPSKLWRWHILQPVVRIARETADHHATGKDVLFVDGGFGLFPFLAHKSRSVRSLRKEELGQESVVDSALEKNGYQCCVFEAPYIALYDFAGYLERIRSLLQPGAVIVAIFIGLRGEQLPGNELEVLSRFFPTSEPTRVAYCGSSTIVRGLAVYQRIVYGLHRRGVPLTAARWLGMVAAAPFAVFEEFKGSPRTLDNAYTPGPDVVSVTMEIRVG